MLLEFIFHHGIGTLLVLIGLIRLLFYFIGNQNNNDRRRNLREGLILFSQKKKSALNSNS